MTSPWPGAADLSGATNHCQQSERTERWMQSSHRSTASIAPSMCLLSLCAPCTPLCHWLLEAFLARVFDGERAPQGHAPPPFERKVPVAFASPPPSLASLPSSAFPRSAWPARPAPCTYLDKVRWAAHAASARVGRGAGGDELDVMLAVWDRAEELYAEVRWQLGRPLRGRKRYQAAEQGLAAAWAEVGRGEAALTAGGGGAAV